MLIMMLGRFQRSLGRTVVTSFIAFIVVPSHADSSPPIFEPCPEVACGGSDAASVLGNAPPRRAWRVNTNISGKSDGDTPHVSAPPITPPAHGIPLECPPDRAALGTHAWSFLHAVAAYFPDKPTDEEKKTAIGLIDTLTTLYPCLHCRAHFKADTTEYPPDVSSRLAFAAWACQAHNRVNAMLGRPTFPCDQAALHARWRASRPECARGREQGGQGRGQGQGQGQGQGVVDVQEEAGEEIEGTDEIEA